MPPANSSRTLHHPSRQRRRADASANEPDPIDVAVGARLKTRRQEIGWTQAKLADALGMTFQQVGKYESGQNRMAASTIHRAAAALNVPVAYFFDGIEADGLPSTEIPTLSAAAVEVARDFEAIGNPNIRAALRQFIRALAKSRTAKA